VKRERLEFLADNPFYTKRFAHYVGRRCRTATIKDVAKELKLDWHTVKELDKQYLKAQLSRAGKPAPKVIGIDEVSIRKGHTYRIVVSDLEKTRPIWFGGKDRSEESLKGFFDELGKPKSGRIRLAVMDMWKPFRNATESCAPQAAVLYDKFHVVRHLGKALDQVRKSEYGRVVGKDRRFIKGQKYTLLSRWDNLSLEGRQALKTLLGANKRIHTAYLLKESFGQLWSYEREGWARRFFENWKAALKWQRLRPYEKFAEMIERHWDGIAAYCKTENKVSLGFVEELNNKIVLSKGAPTALETKSISALKFSLPCYRSCENIKFYPLVFTKSQLNIQRPPEGLKENFSWLRYDQVLHLQKRDDQPITSAEFAREVVGHPSGSDRIAVENVDGDSGGAGDDNRKRASALCYRCYHFGNKIWKQFVRETGLQKLSG
jgi:transposase